MAAEPGAVELHQLHALGLLDLGRLQDADPIMEDLSATGWRHPDLLAMARRRGLS